MQRRLATSLAPSGVSSLLNSPRVTLGAFFLGDAFWLTEGFFKLRGRQSGGEAGHVPADPFKPGGSG